MLLVFTIYVLAGPPPVYKYSLLYIFLRPFYLLSRPSPCLMLFILPCQPTGLSVETGEYWSIFGFYKEEEKKRGRYKGGSIYRREEALRARDLITLTAGFRYPKNYII
jgi:hypothetical protein